MMRKMKNAADEIQCPQHVKLPRASTMLNPNDISEQTVQAPLPQIRPETKAGFIVLTPEESNPK